MAHITNTFYAFQKAVIQYVKTMDSKMRKILHLSDGAASQYKKNKNFANLVNHKDDSGIAAEWHFFATSHGKSPSDAAGGTTKWQTARASLQCPYDKQTLTPKGFYEFAQENIHGIKNFYVSQVDITETELKEHSSSCMQISNTRENHCYTPLNSNTMRVFQIPGSSIFFDTCVLRQYSGPIHTTYNDNALYSYVACTYGGKWWICVVMRKKL
jgi:hypothetical protein